MTAAPTAVPSLSCVAGPAWQTARRHGLLPVAVATIMVARAREPQRQRNVLAATSCTVPALRWPHLGSRGEARSCGPPPGSGLPPHLGEELAVAVPYHVLSHRSNHAVDVSSCKALVDGARGSDGLRLRCHLCAWGAFPSALERVRGMRVAALNARRLRASLGRCSHGGWRENGRICRRKQQQQRQQQQQGPALALQSCAASILNNARSRGGGGGPQDLDVADGDLGQGALVVGGQLLHHAQQLQAGAVHHLLSTDRHQHERPG